MTSIISARRKVLRELIVQFFIFNFLFFALMRLLFIVAAVGADVEDKRVNWLVLTGAELRHHRSID